MPSGGRRRLSHPGFEQRDADLAERAWPLRLRGLSYSLIAAELGESVADVYRCVRRRTDQINAEAREGLSHLRDLELARLDAMLVYLWPQVEAGKAHVVDRVLAIMDRRARYLGLDAPPRAAVDQHGQVVRQYVGVPVPVLVERPPTPALPEPITIDLGGSTERNSHVTVTSPLHDGDSNRYVADAETPDETFQRSDQPGEASE